jgi:LEA14-like dessication related protein
VTHPPVATPRTRRRLGIAALAGTLVGLAGVACGSLLPPADLKPPSIAFSELAIDSIGSERVRFTVRISTRNPNPVDLPLSNVYFDLAVLGQPLALGKVAEQRFTLPANGERDLPVALDVATADLRSVLVRLLAGPTPETVWELKGTANWGASPLPIPFQRRGDASNLRRLRELLLPRG